MSGYTTSISAMNAYKQDKYSATSDYTSWQVVNKLIQDDQEKIGKEAIRDILLKLPAEDFFKIYAERESYQEIPLLTSDGIVIPDIGLRESLQNKDLINNVPLIAGSNADKFSKAIIQILKDDNYINLGKRGEMISKKYSWNNVVNIVDSSYASFLADKKT